MARVYSCPHCGAGASPRDSQCWRCGGSLAAAPDDRTGGPVMRKVGSGPDAAPHIKPVIKDVVGAYGRERELREKEEALQAEMESLEAQNRKVEKLFRKLDEEKKSLESLKASLSDREDELYIKAAILQSAMQAAEVLPKSAPFEEGTADRLADIDPEPVLALERARIRQEVEKEMSVQLERITQLEINLGAQEDELYTNAAILQSALKNGTALPGDAGASREASILRLAAAGDLEPVLALEKARMHRDIEQELAGQYERLAQQAAELNAAYRQMGAGAVVVKGLPDSTEAALAYVRCLKMKQGEIDASFLRLTQVNGVLTLAEMEEDPRGPAADDEAPTSAPAEQ